MNASPPSLNIDQFFVEEIHVKANPAYREQKKPAHETKLEASMSIKRKEKFPEFMVSIELDINKSEKDFKTNPYCIVLKIIGFFSFVKGTDEQTMERMIRLNGSAILYGIARGVVAQATCNSIHDKFILPTVNFVEITEKQTKKKIVKGKPKKTAAEK